MAHALKVILLMEKYQAKERKNMNVEWNTLVDGLMVSVKALVNVIMDEKIILTCITKEIGVVT